MLFGVLIDRFCLVVKSKWTAALNTTPLPLDHDCLLLDPPTRQSLNFSTPTGSNGRKLSALILCPLCATLELLAFFPLLPSCLFPLWAAWD